MRKKIKPETITMWVNIIGFVVSLIFYTCIQLGVSKPKTTETNSLRDSLLKVDLLLSKEIRDLREQQAIFLNNLKQRQNILAGQEKEIRKTREKIKITLKSDWDSLSLFQKVSYSSELIDKLKKQSK